MNDVLNRIEILRKSHELSGNKLCSDTHIAQSTYATWYINDSVPKIDKLQKIADYFNVSIEYLLTGEHESHELRLNEKEQQLLESFKKLNHKGKSLILQLSSDISSLDKYLL